MKIIKEKNILEAVFRLNRYKRDGLIQLLEEGDDVALYKTFKPVAKTVGTGSAGKVLLWTGPGGRGALCVKEMNPGLEDFVDREAAFLGTLNGAGGAPRLYATAPRLGFCVMDYIPGRRLEDLYSEDKLQDANWLLILEKVMLALRQVHKKGLVHLDLHKGNIMVDRASSSSPRVSIIDFGMSQMSGEVNDNFMVSEDCAGAFLAKNGHVSYEAAIGGVVTPESDMVGLGRIVRLVSGRMTVKEPLLLRLAVQAGVRCPKRRPSLRAFLTATKEARVSRGQLHG